MNLEQKYFEAVMNDSISWTIFPLPNRIDINAYQKLENLIYSCCMIDCEESR